MTDLKKKLKLAREAGDLEGMHRVYKLAQRKADVELMLSAFEGICGYVATLADDLIDANKNRGAWHDKRT